MVLMMANILMTIWHQLYSSIENVTQVNSEHRRARLTFISSFSSGDWVTFC